MHQNFSTRLKPMPTFGTMPSNVQRLAWQINDRGQQGIGCTELKIWSAGIPYYLENRDGNVFVRVIGAGAFQCDEREAVLWLRVLGVGSMNIQIKKRWSDTVIFEGEFETIRDAVIAAYQQKISLRGAYLRDADLSGADLSDADLSDADLSDADLSGADLRGAYLRGAYLRGAYLSGAYLRECPVKIPNIHQTIFNAVTTKPDALDMNNWHKCETTHCRAGWVVTLAGTGGAALEYAMGTAAAAALIYMASDPSLEKIPDFYCNNETAMADMQHLAELEKAKNEVSA